MSFVTIVVQWDLDERRSVAPITNILVHLYTKSPYSLSRLSVVPLPLIISPYPDFDVPSVFHAQIGVHKNIIRMLLTCPVQDNVQFLCFFPVDKTHLLARTDASTHQTKKEQSTFFKCSISNRRSPGDACRQILYFQCTQRYQLAVEMTLMF